MEAEMFIQHEAMRFEIYKLLAEYYHLPEEALFGKILTLVDKLGHVCPKAQLSLKQDGVEILNACSIEELKVDYARLFVGPYTLLAPPYGSVYLESERRIMGNSTMDVINRYSQSGLVVAEDYKDAPDHIAAELEFMHFLIFKAIGAASQGDVDRVVISLFNQQSFLEVHLDNWIHKFASSVVENAKTCFYRNLARATEAFINDDYHKLSLALTSWSYDSEEIYEVESFSDQS